MIIGGKKRNKAERLKRKPSETQYSIEFQRVPGARYWNRSAMKIKL